MSEQQSRRKNDIRIDSLDSAVKDIQGDITYIKTRIDNGFSHSIKSTEDKVTYIDERNREDHKLLGSKLDKIIFMWIGGSVSIVIGVVGFIIKGS